VRLAGGLIKTMRDPQMWANKWLSQSLHILNTTAKGGIVAEEDAFADMTEAEEKWAQPDTIVWANHRRSVSAEDHAKPERRPVKQLTAGQGGGPPSTAVDRFKKKHLTQRPRARACSRGIVF